ncbi:MAG: beta-propeller fold lactonase family protein [Alphaproteobacteria bacterium]|nr:beta-propeller fold lactonase family protein [Alphaproteobacteria bacterium]
MASYHVYISVSGDDRIARFTMNAETGRLKPGEDIALSGRPAYTAVDPTRRFMYVARKGSLKISSFAIDPATGDLSEIGTIPIGADPAYLSTDKTGRFLFSASYFDGITAVHRIGDDGAVLEDPIEWRATGMRAHCIESDPSNRFVFVPHIHREDAPNTTFQFRFDETTGTLTPNMPDRCDPPGPDGPRHFCFHPDKPIVYVSNEQGCSVGAYALDPEAGTLSHIRTVSTLPDGWSGENKCSQIRMTPCGRFLYAPNRGHDSIAEFAVNPDGALRWLGYIPAEKIPRVFQIDPAGRFLLSAGHESGRLGVFRIDGETGRLERRSTHPLGSLPMWITILPIT